MKEQENSLEKEELEALAAKTREGKENASAEIISMMYPEIYRFVHYRVSQTEDVEDLTNDVFVKMLQNLETQDGSFLAWLYQIARNRIVDYYRKQSVRDETNPVGEIIETYRGGEGDIEGQFQRQELRKAINKLTEEQQEVVILRFIEGYQANEVAEMLDKSPGAVRTQQYRALKQLKKHLPENNV